MNELAGQITFFPDEEQSGPLMTLEEMRQHKWHVSWSGGKDSTATIILCHEYGVPIEQVTYIRMMYDETIPATLPVMTDFVDEAAETIRSWGYEVRIVKSRRSAKYYINRPITRAKNPERLGKTNGAAQFLRGHCAFSNEKIRTINSLKAPGTYDMLGYAADETARLHRLGGHLQSIMVALGIQEKEAFEICKKYNLLSPLYGRGIGRDGCWVCPNANKRERERLRQEHPELIPLIDDMLEKAGTLPIEAWAHMNNWARDYAEELAKKDQTTLF